MENKTLFDQVADSAGRPYRVPKGIELILKNKQQILDLCIHYQVEEFFVFGSSVDQNFSAESDFDFLVKFKKMSFDQYTDHYFGLHEELETIFQRKIDLITANSLENKFFKEKVFQTRKLLYAA
ncbi:nucleotidyltransferase family protein [Algoriphagus sp. AK58]|uniref:nucleotidyltransferase family protein n=1 Tax=Algoriphagus sp. AK58 TaxID=1406877 RepID=UPI00164EE828|nr:nucleotidyltransferase domain-containing protein [Algoriphagus sp. AK58]MBC6369013.1 nucleotidyltransferase [Algoriphagus sp. AK58]